MKPQKLIFFKTASALLFLTGVGHTIGTLTHEPGPAESAARETMAGIMPMAMAPTRSMLDFYQSNSWILGLLFLALGSVLYLNAPSRSSTAIGALTSAVSAVICAFYLPLPPTLFLATATLGFSIFWISNRKHH